MALLRRITLIALAAAALALGVVAPSTPAVASTVPPPRVISPANDPSAPLKDLILRWHSVAGASKYQVQISPNKDWTNNTVQLPNSGMTLATLFEMPISLPHATYYWRVRAHAGGSWGPYSTPRQFLREWAGPFEMLQQPSSTDPTLIWTAVPGASVYLVRFSTDPGFPTAGTVRCFTQQTSFTPYALESQEKAIDGACFGFANLTNGKSYYWQVQPFDNTTAAPLVTDTKNDPAWECSTPQPECDGHGIIGGPFVYKAPVAGPFNYSTTVTGLKTTWHTTDTAGTTCDTTSACPMTPTFSWTPAKDANYYRVFVFRDPAATNVYRTYDTLWPEITPRDGYLDAQAGSSYYWAVAPGTCVLAPDNRTCSPVEGTAAACSIEGTNATSTPVVTGLQVAPGPGVTGSSSIDGGSIVTVTLTGSGFNSGLCVDPSAGAVTKITNTSSSITFTYSAPNSGGDITFSVTNPDGGTSPTDNAPILKVSSGQTVKLGALSDTATFNKRTDPVPLIEPADGAVEHGKTFTFRWGDFLATGGKGGYDARNYELQLSTTIGFHAPALTLTSIDLTQYTDLLGTLSNGHYFWRVAPIDETGNLLTWSKIREVTVNANSPGVHFSSHDGVRVNHPLKITFSDVIKGVSTRTLKVVPAGKAGFAAVRGKLRLGSSPRHFVFVPKRPLATGATYHLVVSRKLADANGNPVIVRGGPIRTSVLAKNTSHGWRYSSGWTRHQASNAFSGSYVEASRERRASISVAGDQVYIAGCKGPGMGTISFSIAGRQHTVHENQSFTACGVVLWHRALPDGIHTLHVRVTHGRANFDAASVVGFDPAALAAGGVPAAA